MARLKVFITGASSGIGQALAYEYSRQGAVLGLAARRKELLLSLQNKLTTDTFIYAVDVRDQQAMDNAAQDFILQCGIPDVVISNAGVSSGTLTEIKADTETFKTIIDINLTGMVNTFQPFILAMKEKKQGSLAGIASVAGIRGLPGAGAYSASKAAVIAYLESLRIELNTHGIIVTTIAPGYIKTPMTALNNFPMPFLMASEIAAKKFSAAIRQKKKFIIFPWQMRLIAIIIRFAPVWLWDLLMKNAPRKARTNLDKT